MAFRFSLEQVLNYRERLEQQDPQDKGDQQGVDDRLDDLHELADGAGFLLGGFGHAGKVLCARTRDDCA